MARFLFVFTSLLLQMLVVCGKVPPFFTPTSVAEDTSFLPWNSSMSVDAADGVKSVLNCENTTALEIEKYPFLLSLIYSRIISSLNSSFYVQEEDLLTVCSDPWLERVNEFLTFLARLFASLIVLLVNILMPNSFYHGRIGLVALAFVLLSFSSPWLLLFDGSTEDLCAILHVLAGVASIAFMSIHTWMTVFTSSIVMKYLHSKRYIRIQVHSDTQYSIHILDHSFIPGAAWFLGVFLCVLTYLMGSIKMPELFFGELFSVNPKDNILLYFCPFFCFLFLACIVLRIFNCFYCPKLGGSFCHAMKRVHMSFNALLFLSIVTYILALQTTASFRLGSNWSYYAAAFPQAVATALGFYSLEKFDCAANWERPRDCFYEFRVISDVDEKCIFGWTEFHWEKGYQIYEEMQKKNPEKDRIFWIF